jgi:UDP-glucose 4-epimerase
MSILVTGGAGYIGSHMVPELADAGERVVVLDNLSTGFDWAVPKGVPLIIGDTGDQKLVGQIIREHTVDSISILLLRLWSRIRSRIRLATTKTTQSIHEH